MIFLVLSLLLYLLQNIGNKEFSRRYGKASDDDGSAVSLFQNGMCVFFSAVVLALSGGAKAVPAAVIPAIVLFGIFYLLTVFCLLKAMRLGSLGGSTLLCNLGMFVSSVFSIFAFNDIFNFYIGFGMLLFAAAIFLCSLNGSDGGFNKKWLFFALSSGFLNGAVAIVKRYAVELSSELDMKSFLFWGFLCSAVFFVVIFAFQKSKKVIIAKVVKPNLGGVALCGILAGIGTAGANLFQMEAIKSGLSSAVVYPLTAGFLVVALWIVSFVVYKEVKPKITNILAIILCLGAIVLSNIK